MSFAEVEGKLEADFVCCRHVLEHIDEPREFLKALAAKLEPGTAVFFEVPNALFTIRDGGIWDIIYEHCGYFTPSSLKRVFQLAGLQVLEIAESFSGQFLVVHAEVSVAPSDIESVDPSIEDLAAGFVRTYWETIDQWREVLREAHAGGERVVAWGAGSKGNTFLNIVGQNISAIVDINPKKRGKFVAGAGQAILAPEQLAGSSPLTVVIMNPVYRAEIAACLDQLEIESRVLVA